MRYVGGGVFGGAEDEGSWWEAFSKFAGAWSMVGVEADMTVYEEDGVEVTSGFVEDMVLTSSSGEA